MEKSSSQKAVKNLLLGMEMGTQFGLKGLQAQKVHYDVSLRNGNYQDIRYVLFASHQAPSIAFSGVMSPDYDFIGRQLQNLGDHTTDLELITFSSAPMQSGWGFLFSWHEHSSKVCMEYMRSLATAMHEKVPVEDSLFRLVVSCENHAISPQWWESISDENKNLIIDKISDAVDIFSAIPDSYLMMGLEGITNWKFEYVLSNY